MKINKIYDTWTNFLKENKEYFKTEEEQWFETFEEIKKYINENKINSLKDIYNYTWIYTQNNNYKNKDGLMKNMNIYTVLVFNILIHRYIQ